jgi:hypothetical protein
MKRKGDCGIKILNETFKEELTMKIGEKDQLFLSF